MDVKTTLENMREIEGHGNATTGHQAQLMCNVMSNAVSKLDSPAPP